MKKFYKILGLFSITIFSFYYTEKIAIIMQNKSPIMQSINDIEAAYLVPAKDAFIDGDYITPGINGQAINKTKSYVNMKSFGVFNKYYLIFDEIKPDISLDNNKDKIIKQGNKLKNSVAFLLENNPSIIKYFEQNEIKGSILINESSYSSKALLEQINNDKDKYNNLETLLNKNNLNTNICYIKSLSKDFCLKQNKYLVEESLALNSSNFIDIKKQLTSGNIILIKENAKLEEVELLIKDIKFKGLNIVPLSELITEKN